MKNSMLKTTNTHEKITVSFLSKFSFVLPLFFSKNDSESPDIAPKPLCSLDCISTKTMIATAQATMTESITIRMANQAS